jgi:hypothetical protein
MRRKKNQEKQCYVRVDIVRKLKGKLSNKSNRGLTSILKVKMSSSS